MRSPLRNLFLAPALLAAAALATTTAFAESQVNVPFSFTVAGKTCPPGLYDVQSGPIINSVALTNEATSRRFVFLVAPGNPVPTDHRVILTFDQRGDQHALQTIQWGYKITSRLDKPSRKNEYVPTRIMSGQ